MKTVSLKEGLVVLGNHYDICLWLIFLIHLSIYFASQTHLFDNNSSSEVTQRQNPDMLFCVKTKLHCLCFYSPLNKPESFFPIYGDIWDLLL